MCVCVHVPVSESGSSHGGGGQVGVLVLELAVQSQPPLVAVVGQQRGEVEHLAESCLTRLDGEALPDNIAPHQHHLTTSLTNTNTTSSLTSHHTNTT